MKIIHIVFTGPYTPNTTYQDNMLPKFQAQSGHDVELWGTCYRWESGVLTRGDEETFVDNGVLIRRFKYQKLLTDFITRKIRWVKNIETELEKAAPDLIMLHDFQTVTGLAVCRYLKKHPNVKMVVDSHTDQFNSGRNFLSKYILHRMVYRFFAGKISKHTTKILYISPETKDFLVNEYKLDASKMHYLPLGGDVLEDIEYNERREKTRSEYDINDEQIMILHSGKLGKGKKTKLLLDAFKSVKNEKMKLIIAGVCEKDVREDVDKAVEEDSRITFVGWKTATELYDLMCAADIYAQPGTCSASLQGSLCCRCAVLVAPYAAYKDTLVKENGFFITNEKEFIDAIKTLTEDRKKLDECKLKSYEVAKKYLDYKEQGKFIASFGIIE